MHNLTMTNNHSINNHDFKLIEMKTNIGIAIREHRKDLNWTQEYLSFKSNLDRTYIGGVERGERNITLSSLIAITSALNVEISEIFSRAEDLRGN